uniref:Tetraspanin n=1 Tax=Bos mutus grunniens TaxID=30521 RepID=A0A8B9XK59_BOSMU
MSCPAGWIQFRQLCPCGRPGQDKVWGGGCRSLLLLFLFLQSRRGSWLPQGPGNGKLTAHKTLRGPGQRWGRPCVGGSAGWGGGKGGSVIRAPRGSWSPGATSRPHHHGQLLPGPCRFNAPLGADRGLGGWAASLGGGPSGDLQAPRHLSIHLSIPAPRRDPGATTQSPDSHWIRPRSPNERKTNPKQRPAQPAGRREKEPGHWRGRGWALGRRGAAAGSADLDLGAERGCGADPPALQPPAGPAPAALAAEPAAGPAAMAHYKVEQDDWLTVYLKYLLFVFNFFFWVGGAAVMAVGVWTLVEKSGYLGVLASSTFAASAYILIFVGALVMVTGFLGFGAVIREDRGCLSAYFCLLLAIFLVELVAGVLAHVYYQRLSDELKQHLTRTLAENYRQPGAAEITASVDRLQQDFKCCGSNSSADWLQSSYILSPEAEGRRVPDSCCKTVVARCGQRAHPSNIYKVEGGCISKLEQFLADHLLLMGAVGIGVACLQICGMILTCGLHRRLQLHFY